MSTLNIADGALTGSQAAYVSKTYARLLAALPQIKTELFKNRAIYQPVDFGGKSVTHVNYGATELDEQKQKMAPTVYSDLFMEKRWVKLRRFNKAFALTNMDELNSALYPNTLQTPYSQALVNASKRKHNEVALAALLGPAVCGRDEANLSEKVLPPSQYINWDRAGGETFSEVLGKIGGLYVDNDIITDEEEVEAFTFANKYILADLNADPSYSTILENDGKFRPKFKMQSVANIMPIKYGKLPFVTNADESRTYSVPVWTKDSLIIAPWKEFKMEITIDSSLQDNPRKMFAETAVDAVRSNEKSVYVIQFKVSADEVQNG